MAIDPKITKIICDLVKTKPRTIQEISVSIKKNWRTAERYVEKIEEETGNISTRIFRKGTRGALKIVYWNGIEDIHSTSFQEEILDNLMRGKSKGDFTPFDIYQYVEAKNKSVFVEDITDLNPEKDLSQRTDFIGFLKQAKKQILIFSGNLSWINSEQGELKVIDTLRELVKKNVSIKVVTRVSIIGADNVKKLLALNKEIGKDAIEIRHRYQPLRGMIIDNHVAKLREKKYPEYYNTRELKRKLEIFYDIFDKEWIEWLEKVFWKMFSTGIPAEKRLKEIELIKTKLV